jgi:hypothetical protein
LEADIREIAKEEAQKIVLAQAVKPWEVTDNQIRHELRPSEDFRDDTFAQKKISEEKGGIWLVLAKLKAEHVPPEHDADSMVAQSLRFRLKTAEQDGWTLEEAKAWYSAHEDQFKRLDLDAPEENAMDIAALQAELDALRTKLAEYETNLKELEPLAKEGEAFRQFLAGEIARKGAMLQIDKEASTVLSVLGEKATAEQLTAIVTEYDERLAKLPGPVQSKAQDEAKKAPEHVDPTEYA